MKTFEQWWAEAPHRVKYCNAHPAYLSAKEAWEAASKPAETLGARLFREDVVSRLRGCLNEACGNRDVRVSSVTVNHAIEELSKPAAASGEALSLLRDAARAWNNEDGLLDAVMENVEIFLLKTRSTTPPAQAPALPATGEALTKDQTRQIYAAWQRAQETPHGLYLRIIAALKGA